MKPAGKGGSRSLSREFALRALYSQLMTGQDPVDVAVHVCDDKDFAKANTAYFEALFHGVLKEIADLELKLTPHLDRPMHELSPIERGILLLGAPSSASSLLGAARIRNIHYVAVHNEHTSIFIIEL